MMLKYVCSKPTGGGPAPLIHNPVLKWVKALIGLHVFLFFTASAVFAFPSMGDLYCPDLLSNATYSTSCGVVAFTMTFYFSLMACRTWGTEREWATASLVTMTMAILDLVTAIWGILVLVDSSNSMTAHQLEDSGLPSPPPGAEGHGGLDTVGGQSGALDTDGSRRGSLGSPSTSGGGGGGNEGSEGEGATTPGEGPEESPSSAAAETLDCREWKAYLYYYATAFLITLHVTIALFCALVSIFLAKGVGAQLEECRRLV